MDNSRIEELEEYGRKDREKWAIRTKELEEEGRKSAEKWTIEEDARNRASQINLDKFLKEASGDILWRGCRALKNKIKGI